jgi:hypothetical protein
MCAGCATVAGFCMPRERAMKRRVGPTSDRCFLPHQRAIKSRFSVWKISKPPPQSHPRRSPGSPAKTAASGGKGVTMRLWETYLHQVARQGAIEFSLKIFQLSNSKQSENTSP